MSKEAMKLALVALDVVKLHYTQNRHVNEAITALREALVEQPAKQDIPDLIAGALGVSRGTAYDLMREALAQERSSDEQPAQQELYPPPQCTRSHPHENMDAMCELRTEIARLTNENARLKAQPAPVQEPVAKTFGEENVELGVYSDDANDGQQRELVGEVEMGQLVGDGAHKSASNPDAKGEIAVIRGVDEYGPMLDWYEHWVNFPVGTKLYTTPPAAPVQEPYGYVSTHTSGLMHFNKTFHGVYTDTATEIVAVYTHPAPAAQRKPLTDEQIDKLPWGPHEGNPMTFAEGLRDFARAIEAAHGIKENT